MDRQTHLSQLFDLRGINDGVAVIPDDIAALMINHPKSLSDKTLYAIDQYVMRGGKLLVFTDPQADSEQVTSAGAVPMTPGLRGSNLNRLLEVWGVKMETEAVVGDLSVAASSFSNTTSANSSTISRTRNNRRLASSPPCVFAAGRALSWPCEACRRRPGRLLPT